MNPSHRREDLGQPCLSIRRLIELDAERFQIRKFGPGRPRYIEPGQQVAISVQQDTECVNGIRVDLSLALERHQKSGQLRDQVYGRR